MSIEQLITLAKNIYNNSIDDWAGPTKEWEKCLEEAAEIIANQKDE